MKVKSGSDIGKKIFVKHFMKELVRISTDRVVNVRMSLSEVLSVHHAQNPSNSLIRELKLLNDIYESLKKDKSADVREPLLSISGVERQFDDEEETKESDEQVTISVNNTQNNIENTESNQEEGSPTKSETSSEVAVVSEKQEELQLN